jgi:protein-L-isoaspartate(D-aspartate) O-methyltransferase
MLNRIQRQVGFGNFDSGSLTTIPVKDTYRLKGLRQKLVAKLQEKGIHDQAVLKAFEQVPRHYFLDTAFAEHAYEDKPFSIGEGQTISQPFTVAYQTQLLAPEPGMKVMEIGTGSGYQAAILAAVGAEVYTIERFESLLAKAEETLSQMTIGKQVHYYLGDGTEGLPEEAPFDRILVTAAAPSIPHVYIDQLTEGGIMVIPVGNEGGQVMYRVTKLGKYNYREEAFDQFRFVPLTGKYGW